MQQRQPRLGDILDDYCPRERRLTNHVVVAMIGDTVKQTRCSTCEADHEYKHAALPRQRKKSEQSGLYSQVLAAVTPRKIATPTASAPALAEEEADPVIADFEPEPEPESAPADELEALFEMSEDDDANGNVMQPVEEGPAHRRLIRAQLPRHEGQVSTARQAPDFTIRQPNPGRPKRFGARNQRSAGPGQSQGNRQGGTPGNSNGNGRGGAPRNGARPQGGSRPGNRQGGGRNRSK